jgi:hypothetical protein
LEPSSTIPPGLADPGLVLQPDLDAPRVALAVEAGTQAIDQRELLPPPGYPLATGDLLRLHPGCAERLDT